MQQAYIAQNMLAKLANLHEQYWTCQPFS